MAKLIKCKTCEQEIAKEAAVCPHCGAKNAKSKWFRKLLAAYIALMIIWSLVRAPDVDLGPKPARDVYADLTPMDYRAAMLGQIPAGALVAMNGQVTQVVGGNDAMVAMGSLVTASDNLVYLEFESKPQVLVGDFLAIYGRYKEPMAYTTIFNEERTVPSVVVDYYENVLQSE